MPGRLRTPTGLRAGALATLVSLLALTFLAAPGAQAAVTNTFTGTAGATATWKVHTFAVPADGYRTLTLTWSGATTNLDLGLKSPAGTFVQWSTRTTGTSEVIARALTAGTWTLVVQGKSGPDVPYSVVLDDTPPVTCAATFCGTAPAGGALTMKPYVVTTAGQLTARLNWTDPVANLNVGLRSPSGVWRVWTSSTTQKPETATLAVTAADLGTWMVGVIAKTGTSAYTVDVSQGGPTADQKGSVSGTVFKDADGDGVREPGEVGLSGARVEVFAADGSSTGVVVSDVSGAWTLPVLPGTYRLDVGMLAGYGYGPVTPGGSVVNPRTGRSGPVTVGVSQAVTGLDVSALATGGVTYRGTSTASASGVAVLGAPGAGTLNLSLEWDESADADLDVALTDDAGVVLGSTTSTTAKPEVLSVDVPSGGTYRAVVSSKGGSAFYVLTVGTRATAVPATTNPVYQSTIGGTGRADTYPSGLDVDPTGTTYLADTGGDAVEAYSAAGTRLWKVGAYGRGPGLFSEPRDVAYLDGKLYVADTGNNRIQVLDATDGHLLSVWTTFYKSIMGVSAGVDAAGAPVVLGTEGYLDIDVVRVHDPATGTLVRTVGLGRGSGPGQLDEPRDAATGADGSIYVADFRNHRIAVFAADGTWLRSFGSLGAAHGQFNGPYGVDLDDAGVVYVTDANNHRIERMTPTGGYLSTLGSNGTGPGQFTQLRRAVVGSGPDPLVYGADLWAYKVEVFSNAGASLRTLAGTAPPVGGFNKPNGLAVTSTDVLVADTANQRIQRFNLAGALQQVWGTRGFGTDIDGLNWLRDVTIVPADGTIWAADTKNNRLVQYAADGTATGRRLGTLGAGPGQFNWPYALTTTGNDLLVADTFNNRVQRITTTGQVVWTASGMARPRDIVAKRGIVYVADNDNKRVVELDVTDGSLITSFGTTTLHAPGGIAVAPDGDVFVSDTTWNRLVRFAPDGTVVSTYGKQGTLPGQFNQPTKIEIRQTSTGVQMYVADTANDRVQVFKVG